MKMAKRKIAFVAIILIVPFWLMYSNSQAKYYEMRYHGCLASLEDARDEVKEKTSDLEWYGK